MGAHKARNAADEAGEHVGEAIAAMLKHRDWVDLVLLHLQQAAGQSEQASDQLDGKKRAVPA